MLEALFSGPQTMVTGVTASSKIHTLLDLLINHHEHGDSRQMTLWTCNDRKQVRSMYEILKIIYTSDHPHCKEEHFRFLMCYSKEVRGGINP